MTSTVYKAVSSQSLPAIPCENAEILMNESDTYEVLKKKKQALEEKLNLKLQQFKSLCIKEAEIIGELPPETPLGPNEPVPQFRRRIGAEFILNQNLLSKAQYWDEENLDRLELELELQRKIVKANLKLTNEVNLKKNVKKKRQQNYQDAVLKLKEVEKRLLEVKRKNEAGSKLDGQKAQSVINFANTESSKLVIRPKSSLALVSDIPQSENDGDDEESAGRYTGYLSISAPSTPVNLRERHIRPISPVDATYLLPENCYLRPNSVHFAPGKGYSDTNNQTSGRWKNTDHFSHDYDSCSIGSANSCDSSILRIAHETKRRNILSLLQTHNSSESLGTGKCHKYSLPLLNSTVGSTSRLTNIDRTKFNNVQPNDMNLLMVHDHSEDGRRKGCISTNQIPHTLRALHSQPSSVHHYDYLDNTVLAEQREEFLRQEIMKGHQQSQLMSPHTHLTINMASRPLPPPPSCNSLQSTQTLPSTNNPPSNCSYKTQAKFYQDISELPKTKAIPEDHLDISSKAVRSSVIRTPIAITISTSSADSSQIVKPRLLSVPTPSPSTRNYPTSNSPLASSNNENVYYAIKATTFNPENYEPSHSTTPLPKVWSETDLDSPSSKVERKYESKYSSSSTIYHNNSGKTDSMSADSHNYENIEPTDQSNVQSKNESSCPSVNMSSRPPSITLSPTIPPSLNGVEVNVVSVGHFQPYWEETKPYELADFYKYSAKHRKKALTESGSNRNSIVSNSSIGSGPCQPKNQLMLQEESELSPESGLSCKINPSCLFLEAESMPMKGDCSSNYSSSYQDCNTAIGPKESISGKDELLKKESLDDANWYKNDIVKNPTVV